MGEAEVVAILAGVRASVNAAEECGPQMEVT